MLHGFLHVFLIERYFAWICSCRTDFCMDICIFKVSLHGFVHFAWILCVFSFERCFQN